MAHPCTAADVHWCFSRAVYGNVRELLGARTVSGTGGVTTAQRWPWVPDVPRTSTFTCVWGTVCHGSATRGDVSCATAALPRPSHRSCESRDSWRSALLAPGVRLLFVCTGNLCRSPLAERLAVARVRAALPDEWAHVQCGSAGLAAPHGQAMHPHSAAALIGLGGDPDGFRSRAFLPQMADDADLVLTMTRVQRKAVLERTPRGLRRTFTLREAADLVKRADVVAGELGPLAGRATALAERLHAGRSHRRSDGRDDIADPIGGSATEHEAAAQAVAGALRPLLAVLFPADSGGGQNSDVGHGGASLSG